MQQLHSYSSGARGAKFSQLGVKEVLGLFSEQKKRL